ncbi:MAG: two component transcriptional regulator, LuxR family [Solirubrobacterales bacterium]|jgi:DNA-binding NarL/FixJ family response regulator|nr:two component transcriptional regulator, LuxR family [Solirubrobacterales bacterium]
MGGQLKMSGDTSEVAAARLLLVDDHALFRRGLRRLLEGHGFEVAGEASNGRAAVQLAAELEPEIIIMDLSMPLMGGVEAITHIVKRNPDARILVLTISAGEAEVLDALLVGACGYLLKDARAEDIVQGVRAAAAGESMISPRIASRLVMRLREAAPVEHPSVGELSDAELTDREMEILRLIACGKENSAIADELFISPKTVKNHVASILGKLNIENRIQAAVVAVRSGLVQ